jgi:uncharacterized protein YndB with AHSA1/START domain
MLDPLIKTIEVPCAPDMAFRVFIEEMDSWWPKAKFTTSAMAGAPAKEIRVGPRVGGQIMEIMTDGSENLWGTIKTYEPPSLLVFDFHFAPPGMEVTGRTHVEVRFTETRSGSTQIVLTQTDWEELGEWAEPSRGGYGHGWDMILGGYAQACAG